MELRLRLHPVQQADSDPVGTACLKKARRRCFMSIVTSSQPAAVMSTSEACSILEQFAFTKASLLVMNLHAGPEDPAMPV